MTMRVHEIYRLTTQNFPLRLLHLSKLSNEVPESRFGGACVWGKNPHLVQSRGPVLVSGQHAPNDFVFY